MEAAGSTPTKSFCRLSLTPNSKNSVCLQCVNQIEILTVNSVCLQCVNQIEILTVERRHSSAKTLTGSSLLVPHIIKTQFSDSFCLKPLNLMLTILQYSDFRRQKQLCSSPFTGHRGVCPQYTISPDDL